VDRIQHDHRDLPFGLELIIGVGWPKYERFFPKPGAFVAGCSPRPRLQLLGPDLYLDLGISENVAVPSRVFGRASLRGDYEETVSVGP
jgi:hypothetical protein